MGIESTITYRRSSAIWKIKSWLEDNKNKVVPKNNSAKELTSVLDKLNIPIEQEQPLAYLTEEEYDALYFNIDLLTNNQLEELLYKFRDSIFVNYEVGNDDWNMEFDC